MSKDPSVYSTYRIFSALVLFIIATLKQTKFRLAMIRTRLDTQHTHHTRSYRTLRMRQMQMLLFARFGVCPSQSLTPPGPR